MKDTYAMKGLSKGYIIKTGMQESVMNERNILLMTNSDPSSRMLAGARIELVCGSMTVRPALNTKKVGSPSVKRDS